MPLVVGTLCNAFSGQDVHLDFKHTHSHLHTQYFDIYMTPMLQSARDKWHLCGDRSDFQNAFAVISTSAHLMEVLNVLIFHWCAHMEWGCDAGWQHDGGCRSLSYPVQREKGLGRVSVSVCVPVKFWGRGQIVVHDAPLKVTRVIPALGSPCSFPVPTTLNKLHMYIRRSTPHTHIS